MLADEELMQLVYGATPRPSRSSTTVMPTRRFRSPTAYACSAELAEDVIQEAFLSLWRSRARYERARGSVRSWILGIVHNRSIDAVRRRRVRDRGETLDEQIESHLAAPERTDVEFARREEAREVREALERLPAEQSRVIELAYFGGMTHVQIATLLDEPIGTVKGRMRLGLAKMRIALGPAAEAVQ